MKSNYKRLGNYIGVVDKRNRNLEVDNLIGLSIEKRFTESKSNIIGTDMSTYRILNQNQFSYCNVTSRNGEKITIALYQEEETAMVSQAYDVFEVTKPEELLPEYLMMWFRRPEFDRYARFMSHGSVREMFSWEDMCEVMLPVPHPDKQKEIVKEYHTIVNRITLNNQLIQKLEETAQAIYKQWFVDFEFPNEDGKPYKSNGGEMEMNLELEKEIPKGWRVDAISNLVEVKDGTHDSPEPTELGHPLVTSTHLNLYDISLSETYNISSEEFAQANKRSKVGKHDILFSMIGTIGLINYILYDEINFAIKNVGLFKTSTKKNIAEYILFFLKSDYLKNHLATSLLGSTQNYVTLSFLREIPILVPDENLLLNFENHAEKIVNRIYLKVKENNMLESIKDLLLSKLATIEN